MSSFPFEHIQTLDKINFSQPIIWVLNATKTPPHIGFSTAGYYFSLKANGKDELILCENILELINRKQIPTLFIQLQVDITLEKLSRTYQDFNKAGQNQTTCLSPISQLLEQKEAKQLSQLLRQIESDIQIIAGSYLPENYKQLPTYSLETIQQHIEDLKVYVGE